MEAHLLFHYLKVTYLPYLGFDTSERVFCPILFRNDVELPLDNYTEAFLATKSGRFEFVFTPKHGSWLNMIEGFFGKMTHQMLRGIRVESIEELASRIYKYFDEVNKVPVVHRWKYKMDEINPNEEVQIGLAI